jgi:hypothetical protein
MQPTIEYADPTTHRRTPWRKILLGVAVVIAVPIVLFGGLIAWYQYEMTRNGVVIMVDNQSTGSVDATLFDTVSSRPVMTLNGVAPARRGELDQNTWRSITPATFRVRVGTRTYQGDAGYLLDDDGPHRFWVKAFDDRVVVTRQSNEAPWDLEMSSLGSATKPAGKRHRAGHSGNPTTVPRGDGR